VYCELVSMGLIHKYYKTIVYRELVSLGLIHKYYKDYSVS